MTRARRGRGEGSIYQRSDGLWVATISVGYGTNGKRRRKTVYGKTKGESQEKLRKVAGEVAAGRPIEAQKITIANHLDRWLRAIKQSVAPATHDRYESSIKHQLKPQIGGIRLAKLEPAHVEQLYLDLRDAGCSPRSIQLAGITLGAALKHAVRVRLIPFNPAQGIAKPRVPRKELSVWNSDQVAVFLKATEGDRLHAMYVVELASGLRQGELFALEWPDIDFDKCRLTVSRSLEELRGKVRIKEPKTGRGRQIVMPRFSMKALREHRKSMLAEGNIAGAVFCAPEGGHLRKGNVYRRSFMPLVKSAGVPKIRFHDLRHTHATLLLLAGENVKVVSERLGHANVKVTLDTYAHVLPSMQKAAADKLQRLLG